MTADRGEAIRALEQEIGVLSRRIRRVIAERARAVHESLQPAAYLLLSHVAREGSVRASEAAEVLALDKGAVSRQVTGLLELGLLEAAADPDDGRATRLSVTDEGERRLRRVGANRRRWLDERLGDWTDDEVASFVRALHRYNRAFE